MVIPTYRPIDVNININIKINKNKKTKKDIINKIIIPVAAVIVIVTINVSEAYNSTDYDKGWNIYP